MWPLCIHIKFLYLLFIPFYCLSIQNLFLSLLFLQSCLSLAQHGSRGTHYLPAPPHTPGHKQMPPFASCQLPDLRAPPPLSLSDSVNTRRLLFSSPFVSRIHAATAYHLHHSHIYHFISAPALRGGREQDASHLYPSAFHSRSSASH